MPFTTLFGHPLHPQLVAFPIGMLSFSSALDFMYLATGEHSFADAAYYNIAGGLASGAAAGVAGAFDYFEIPEGTKSKQTANAHAILNLGIMGLYGLNLFLRRGRKVRSGPVPALLGLLGAAGLVASAWYGGELVYELGMRVKPAMEGDETPQLRPPGDERLEAAFRAAEENWVPGGASTSRH